MKFCLCSWNTFSNMCTQLWCHCVTTCGEWLSHKKLLNYLSCILYFWLVLFRFLIITKNVLIFHRNTTPAETFIYWFIIFEVSFQTILTKSYLIFLPVCVLVLWISLYYYVQNQFHFAPLLFSQSNVRLFDVVCRRNRSKLPQQVLPA